MSLSPLSASSLGATGLFAADLAAPAPSPPSVDTASGSAATGTAATDAPASSSPGGFTPPALAAEKQLKAMSQALIAITLIKDPVARAKAAADLYKQYSQVAKTYADAQTREAASDQAAEAAPPSPAAPSDDAGTTGAPSTGSTSTGAPAPGPPPATNDPSAATTQTPNVQAQAQALAAAPSAAAGPSSPPSYMPDPVMDEIKTFAEAAKSLYEAALQAAKAQHGDSSKLNGAAGEMADAKNVLTQAAQAVEGPAATADGYDASGAASGAAAPTSVMGVTA